MRLRMTELVKQAVQNILKPFGAQLARVPKAVEPVLPFDVLEALIFKELARLGDDFYFIQVGANDGVLNDFLNPLIRKYQLKGCLVEPMPDVFELLRKNYADQPQLDFRNVLIGDANGTGTIHRFKRGAAVPADFYHGLARQDGNYIEARARQHGLGDAVEAIYCPMQDFGALLDSLPTRNIALLYVDTEGSDDQVVLAALSAGLHPAIIQYEWTEMPVERRAALKQRLLEFGYRFLDVGADTVCLRVG